MEIQLEEVITKGMNEGHRNDKLLRKNVKLILTCRLIDDGCLFQVAPVVINLITVLGYGEIEIINPIGSLPS